MRGHLASSRPLQARGLRRIAILVPVGCAEKPSAPRSRTSCPATAGVAVITQDGEGSVRAPSCLSIRIAARAVRSGRPAHPGRTVPLERHSVRRPPVNGGAHWGGQGRSIASRGGSGTLPCGLARAVGRRERKCLKDNSHACSGKRSTVSITRNGRANAACWI